MSSGLLLQSFVVVLSVTTLFLLCLAFSTDFWVVHTVNRDKIKEETKSMPEYKYLLVNDSNYFSRNRGLFRTCYKGNETLFLDGNDGNCLTEEGYEWSARDETSDWDDSYHQRKHLMRAHLMVMSIAMLTSLLGSFCAVLTCLWWEEQFFINCGVGFMSATTVLIVLFMACFHSYRNLERNEIKQGPFEKVWSSDAFLENNTKVEFGFSFYLAWVSFGTSICAVLLFIVYRMKWKDDQRKTKMNKMPKKRKINKMKNERKVYPQTAKHQPPYAPFPQATYQAPFPQFAYQQPVVPQVEPMAQKLTVIHHYPKSQQNLQPEFSQRSLENPGFQNVQTTVPRKNYDVKYAFMDVQ